MAQKTDKPAVEDEQAPEDVSGEDVAAYLDGHPDFFSDRLELLSKMVAPSRWSGDAVVDMQRFLAERRLGEIDDLRNCAQEVIETSRTNMSVQTRSHAAVLAMLAATDVDHLLHVIDGDLPLLLDVDVVMVAFEPSQTFTTSADVHGLTQGAVDGLLGAEENVRLIRDVAGEMNDGIYDGGTLFGAASGLVHSAALARLRPGSTVPAGLMALGARGAAFGPGQGTELIGFLARVLESCLHRLAETPG